MFDIAQAAIGMDGSGPVEFIPKGYEGTEYATMKYANGIVMTEQPYREDNANAQGNGIQTGGTAGRAPGGHFRPHPDRKSTRLNSSHPSSSRMPSSA